MCQTPLLGVGVLLPEKRLSSESGKQSALLTPERRPGEQFRSWALLHIRGREPAAETMQPLPTPSQASRRPCSQVRRVQTAQPTVG